MKQGSAILMVVLFLSIITIYLASLLDTSGQLVEAAKMRQQEIKKTYAAEGLARVGIEALRLGQLKPGGSLNYSGGVIAVEPINKTLLVKSIYEGKKVVVKLDSRNLRVLIWRVS